MNQKYSTQLQLVKKLLHYTTVCINQSVGESQALRDTILLVLGIRFPHPNVQGVTRICQISGFIL